MTKVQIERKRNCKQRKLVRNSARQTKGNPREMERMARETYDVLLCRCPKANATFAEISFAIGKSNLILLRETGYISETEINIYEIR